jgi:hypothetical protein
MKIRRHISGALHNFLETYASRYSDYEGYWLFGLLIEELDQMSIDLLAGPEAGQPESPKSAACKEAIAKFCEQISKAGIPISCFRSAALTVAKSSPLKRGSEHGCYRDGFDVTFRVEALSDLGKRYEIEKSVFVAPHDPKVESRSKRAPNQTPQRNPPSCPFQL